MSEPSREERRQALAKMIEGQSDEQITAGVVGQGPETVLGQLFGGMAEAFVPARATGQQAVIQYDVKAGDHVCTYQLKVADGACELVHGAQGPARVTVSIAVADLLRLVTGQANGQQLFMGGKLRLQGDMAIAMVMQQWFQP